MKAIIRIQALGKQYTIGAKAEAYSTIRESLVSAVRKPIDLFKRSARTEETKFWALKDVSFDVMPGEVLGIIGRNGAGKSTLLKILSRIVEPTSGRVELYGRIGSLLEVGTGFHPELSGRENIYLNGAILGMRREEISRKFDEIVDFAEIERFLDTPVKRYSSGMYVRLAFAVAAHLEPEVLVVDEVLAVGDAQFQKKCLNKMKDVGRHGRTVLFVSHDMQAISRLCDRVAWLSNGELRSEGETHQTISSYLTEFARKGAERVWGDLSAAPGNEKVRLLGVRVCDAEGTTAPSIRINEPVEVEVTYEVLKAGLVGSANCHFFNEQGACIFVSSDWSDDWKDKPRRAGLFKSSVQIPANFLSSGTVSVTAAFSSFKPFVVHFAEPDSVTFQVVESPNGKTARGDYTGHWPGIVRPMFDWITRES